MKEASALGARTARACESCLKVRARWFCAADDAFLCHGCDNMVHSANQLARRHERVKLQTASSKVNYSVTLNQNNKVAWHSGFTRKARTPRHNSKHVTVQLQEQQKKIVHEEEVFFNNTISLPLVPELGSEEALHNYESEEQLLCRVPVFDAELCSVYNEVKEEVLAGEEVFDLDNFSSELLPSDMDLAEFAADVESLLGNGADEDSSEHVKGSELLLDCKEEDEEMDACVDAVGAKETMVKVKDEEELDSDTPCHLDSIILDMNSEAFNWNDIVGSESLAQEQEEEASTVGTDKKDMFLRLNYEDVISAWASQGCSPWTTGTPPNFNSDDCWPDFLGSNGGDVQCCYGEMKSLRGHADGGREARVSRYREKRRTRLFAKKIRYEVRKLNAEKRPRMKGRFVKRTSIALPA
ncbi:zinc finger protein CONSTANS-LIKE 16-like [Vigna umbellata]|uniref:zinc finger protein CONSTANS-LIKE 16-like n=1 Tax=Vigna umbellata TaxID=87088 RepID=UPI001F5E96EE|nr:zinc finger protein CONSTANS-LIKE 16-like [Vigna umbellata]